MTNSVILMQERFSPTDFSDEFRYPNQVAEFVFGQIDDFKELSADDLPGGEEAFRQVLVKSLENQKLGTVLGPGGIVEARRLLGQDRVIIKRLRIYSGKSKKNHPWSLEHNEMSPEEYFRFIEQEHELLRKYFGDRFVPHTEFLQVNAAESGLAESSREFTWQGKEFVEIQEKISGQEMRSAPAKLPLTPLLREELEEFIRRYNNMRKLESALPEDQVNVDYKNNRVVIFDTNHLIDFRSMVEKNPILPRLEIVPDSINTPQDLIDAVCRKLNKRKYAPGEYRDFLKSFKGDFLSEDMLVAGYLQNTILRFPPEGDNSFIQLIKEKFKL